MKFQKKRDGLRRPDSLILEGECCGLNSRGQGVVKIEGYPVYFVDDLLPREKARFHSIKQTSSYGRGKIVERINGSSDRVSPHCPYFGKCGGCQLSHLTYQAQLAQKVQTVKDAWQRIGKMGQVDLQVEPSPLQWGYRNKASYPVTPYGIGFYEADSHRLVPIERCSLVDRRIDQIYQELRRSSAFLNLRAYDERTGLGLVRHVVLRSDDEGVVALLVVTDAQMTPQLKKFVDEVKTWGLKGLGLNLNPMKGNRILTEQVQPLWGDLILRHRFENHWIEHDSTAFFQVNQLQAKKMFQYVTSLIESNSNILELYSGVGAMTSMLAKKAQKLTCVEIWGPAVEQAKHNLSCFQQVTPILAPAEKISSDLFQPDQVLVVDPPRSGLDRQVVDQILISLPKQVIYVSCDPATLARDAALLSKKYKVESLRSFDLFPQTAHVETVCLLSKLDAYKHINVEIKMNDLDLTSTESQATYTQIKEYILKKYNLKVSTLNIAQIKKKYGIKLRENYNKSKKDKQIVPQCKPEKENAIIDALKQFKMI